MSKRLLLGGALLALTVSSCAFPSQYPSTDDEIDALSTRITESLECVASAIKTNTSDQAKTGGAIAEAIADSSASMQLIEDARFFSRQSGAPAAPEEAVGDVKKVQIAIGTLMMIGSDQTLDPLINYGAMASMLIASITASKGICVVPEEFSKVRASAISALRSSDEVVSITGTRVDDDSGSSECDSNDLSALALADGQYEANGVVLSHENFIELLEKKRDEDPTFECVEIISSGSEIDVRRVLSFPHLGLQMNWQKPEN